MITEKGSFGKSIFLIAFLTLLLSFDSVVSAVVMSNPKDRIQRGSRYVPGQVLVKFREGVDPQLITAQAQIAPKNIQRIHSIKPLTARFIKNYKAMRSPSGIFPFSGKSYKDIDAIPDDEIFREAYKSAPETEKSLYRSYKIDLPEGMTVEEAVSKLKNNPDVEYAEPNGIVKLQSTPLPNLPYIPNDRYLKIGANYRQGSWGQPYPDLWGFKSIQAIEAWNVFDTNHNGVFDAGEKQPGEDIVVAVIDSGVDYNHPDIASNMWHDANGHCGYDFVNNDDDPMDDNGHGTHVAGIIAAVGNNSIGVIGVAPKARIMAIKGINNYGDSYISNLADCVIYAADNGAEVLNCSWAYNNDSQTIKDAFSYAYAKGSVCVAAAGNFNSNVMGFSPANIDTVIAVAAVDQADRKCYFSNYGSKIIAAPGGGSGDAESDDVDNILSTIPDTLGNPNAKVSNGYYRWSGTSMACPYVAGIAALILSMDPTLTNDEVGQKIKATADDIGIPGKDDYYGYGRANAYKAVNVDIGISSPADNSFIHGTSVTIKGLANMAEGFQAYELWYAPIGDPDNAIQIPNAPDPQNRILGIWDITNCPDGKYLVTVKVINTSGKIYASSITVTVDNINDPPVFKNLDNKAMAINRINQFRVETVDPDDPATPQAPVLYSAQNLPSGAQFDPSTQIFTWQPGGADKGVYEVTFTASDGENTGSRTISLITVVIEETQITTDTGIQRMPHIYGDRIVWTDWRNAGSDIYMRNLTTGQETRVTTDSNLKWGASVYGNWIVWVSEVTGQNEAIYRYNIQSGNKYPVTANYHNHYDRQEKPAIYGNKIIWGENHIYMYDMTTGRTTTVVSNGRSQNTPVIHCGKIAYLNKDVNEQGDIYVCNLTAGSLYQITNNPAAKYDPDIYDDRIVWTDYRNAVNDSQNADIYAYNLTTGQESRITTETAHDRQTPKIYGDKIVWAEHRQATDQNTTICIHDLSTGCEGRITDSSIYDSLMIWAEPDIYENMIAWTDNRNGNHDIYMARFYFAPQITSITPTTVFPGDALTITGNNLGYHQDANSNVLFPGGINTAITSWSNNQIVCVIPDNIIPGPVYVETMGGLSNSIDINIPAPLNWHPNAPNTSNRAAYVQGVAHSGTRSLKLINSVNGQSCWYGDTITFYAPYPKTLNLSGWAKGQNISSGSLAAIDYCVVFEDNTYIWYYPNSAFPAGSYNWKNKSETKTFAKGVKSVTPYLLLYNGTGTVWYDDISISTTGNIILNSDVEQGTTQPNNWTYSGNGAWVTDASNSPTHSLKMINSYFATGYWMGANIVLNSPYPDTFTFGGYSKALNVNTGVGLYALEFFIKFEDNSTGWFFPPEIRFSAGTHNWQKKETSMIFGKKVKEIQPYCYLYDAKGTVWFDDIYAVVTSPNLVLNPGIEQSS